MQFAPDAGGAYWFLSDNGFGAQRNSADYLLRIYQLRLDFKGRRGGRGEVAIEGFVQFADPDGFIPFDIVNEGTTQHLLTGADFDVESFVVAENGDIWVGEEFGPFILHFDSSGALLQAPIATPGIDADGKLSSSEVVSAPQSPFLENPSDANLRSSRGYEGMAFSPNRRSFYPLLEGTVNGDPAGALRIYEFGEREAAFTGLVGFYKLEEPDHAVGDFTPINQREFLIIERDSEEGQDAEFKKIFKVNLERIDASGFVEKVEIADLLNIADPDDLNDDGETVFTFPFLTIENVLVLGERELLVANDNNYPFRVARGPDIDNNEFIVLELQGRLDLDERLGIPRVDGDEKD